MHLCLDALKNRSGHSRGSGNGEKGFFLIPLSQKRVIRKLGAMITLEHFSPYVQAQSFRQVQICLP